jgi:hypothetical protein
MKISFKWLAKVRIETWLFLLRTFLFGVLVCSLLAPGITKQSAITIWILLVVVYISVACILEVIYMRNYK